MHIIITFIIFFIVIFILLVPWSCCNKFIGKILLLLSLFHFKVLFWLLNLPSFTFELFLLLFILVRWSYTATTGVKWRKLLHCLVKCWTLQYSLPGSLLLDLFHDRLVSSNLLKMLLLLLLNLRFGNRRRKLIHQRQEIWVFCHCLESKSWFEYLLLRWVRNSTFLVWCIHSETEVSVSRY